ncbi:glycosyltransferase [Patescibacteria group bacterium]|nr:glycosyltransferase [Patescibacteria group bacterium]MBU1889900.1 glycosyltransferase [Patescibacteria group bacterium]
MKIALVHDHLAQDGGAEKVLQVFQEIFPNAPTYTLVYNRKNANPSFRNKKINTSFIQKMPLGVRRYQWYLPWMPTAVEKYDLTEYDVILSSCSAFAKGVITRPDTVHICYCHSPTRYLWSDTYSYVNELHYPKFVKGLISMFLPRIRLWDQMAAQRVDKFIANSEAVQQRIRKYYRRGSDVIYPPVNTSQFTVSKEVGDYYLIGGRIVPYKRFDLAIQAFNKLHLPLKVFGSGAEEKRLRSMAKSNIEFLGQVDDDQRRNLYRHAKAFLYPQEEDFGITAIEAMASGRPVIAYAKGGALDTVIDGKTGVFFHDQNWAALADTVLRFNSEKFDPNEIHTHAQKYNVENFKSQILAYINEHTANNK